MQNYLKPRLDFLVNNLSKDLALISSKKKDDEWKRDHYRYTFTVSAQRIFNLLNTSLTGKKPSDVKESTRQELIILKNIIEDMLKQD